MLDTAAVAHYEQSDASLLAMTPAIPRMPRAEVKSTWPDMRLYLENRLSALRNWRLSWWEYWARLAENILPRRYHWLITPNSMNRGLPINQAILDTTPMDAVNVCSAGMMSGLTNPARPWFKFKVAIANYVLDHAGQMWLEEVERRVYAVLAGSNFYTSMAQMYEDLVVFGTAPVIIYEDKTDVIRLFNPCAGEYYLAVGSDFRVNTLYRTFVLTVMQLVEMFGLDNCPAEVRGLWVTKGSNLDTEIIVAHAIEPNFAAAMPGQDANLGKIGGGFTWREYYWLWGKSSEKPLSVRGFRDEPFIAPRWKTTSNDAYGRSPGMDALGDVVQLHVMTRRYNEAVEKGVRPPMQADVKLRNEPSSTLPGKITYVTDVEKGGMRAIYEMPPAFLEPMAKEMEALRGRVRSRFFNDQFLMISQMEGVQPRNELEIIERRGEKLQVLGPVVESQQGELAKALRRVVSIMGRRQLLPPKPPSIAKVPVEIEFVSMFSLAQKAAQTATMERTINVGAKMQSVFPEVLDNINPDEFFQTYADMTAFPANCLNGPDAIQKLRATRRQQQKAQQAAQHAAALAPVAADTAKTLSDTDTGGGLSALQVMLGQQGAPSVGPVQGSMGA